MRYAVSRSGWALALLTFVALLPWLAGDDPARMLVRAGSAERELTPEALAAVRADLGLDVGPAAMVAGWFAGLAHGDLGSSWVSGTPVAPAVGAGVGVSLTLMSGALLVAVVTAGLLVSGTIVVHGRGLVRRKAGVLAAGLAASPEFLIATGLLLVGSVTLGWFPPYGWAGPRHLVLPALALGLPAGGVLGRLLDDAVPGVYGERWVRTWTAAGVTPPRIAWSVMRRCLPALLPQVALVVVGLTGGAVLVEHVFAIPGLGRTALQAAVARDLPMLQGCVLALLLLGLAAGVVADLTRRRLLGRALVDAALVAAPVSGTGRGRRWVSVALATLLVVVVVAGLWRDPYVVDPLSRLQPPSGAHPLGTDALGRDVLARLGHGAARTAAVATLVTAATFLVGVVTCVLPSAFAGAIETVNALPPVLAGLITAALLGPSVAGAAVAVAAVSWVALAAHAIALANEARASKHVEAARALGVTRWHAFSRHVVPAVLGPVFRHALVRLPGIAIALTSLGFLGLGAQPPTPEWGQLLAEGLPYLERAPWAATAPALMLAALGALAVSLSLTVTAPRWTRSAAAASAVDGRVG
jgi:peptide/nickel transport system permease protein